jgi:hypothetical protein
MISDRIRLAGPEAFIIREGGGLNLGGTAPGGGRSRPLPLGRFNRIEGLHYTLAGERLEKLLAAEDSDRWLLRFGVVKEILPDLFADPHEHRVHTLAGHEGLRRGELINGRVLDVDGEAALVSVGDGELVWTSVQHRFPAPSNLRHMGWELATPRALSRGGWNYDLELETWREGDDLDSAGVANAVVVDAGGGERRAREELDLKGVTAFRVVFRARVHREAEFEAHHEALLGEGVGRPLLRSVSLLESVPSHLALYSLGELLSRSERVEMLTDGGALHAVTGLLPLQAMLAASEHQEESQLRYEHLVVEIGADAFATVVMRMMGEQLQRPAPPWP